MRRVGELSVGERQRVEILKALYRDARILILDEPTAVLTPQESTALFATLQQLVAQGPVDHLHLAQARRGAGGLPPRPRAARRQAGRRARRRRRPTAPSWPQLMVGRDGQRAEGRAAGAAATRICELARRDRARRPRPSRARRHRARGPRRRDRRHRRRLRQRPGRARRAGLRPRCSRAPARSGSSARQSRRWPPRAIVARGVARIPEDRHARRR